MKKHGSIIYGTREEVLKAIAKKERNISYKIPNGTYVWFMNKHGNYERRKWGSLSFEEKNEFAMQFTERVQLVT